MTIKWTQATLQSYIDERVEESLTLDYKAADALGDTDSKKKEIRKDVSAMANSAGGTLIYGIREFQDEGNRHRPERLDPIKRSAFSKERLEHIISGIRPRLSGVEIHPIEIDEHSDQVVYVVEIPQSGTAHQADDLKYYKRFNFEAVAMQDYELRDTMNRRQHPKIVLEFRFTIANVTEDSNPFLLPSLKKTEPKSTKVAKLQVIATNEGIVYGLYAFGKIETPAALFDRSLLPHQLSAEMYGWKLEETTQHQVNNTIRDLIRGGGGFAEEYAPARHVPVLPNTQQAWQELTVTPHVDRINWKATQLKWIVYCDNALPESGEIAIKDIPIIRK